MGTSPQAKPLAELIKMAGVLNRDCQKSGRFTILLAATNSATSPIKAGLFKETCMFEDK